MCLYVYVFMCIRNKLPDPFKRYAFCNTGDLKKETLQRSFESPVSTTVYLISCNNTTLSTFQFSNLFNSYLTFNKLISLHTTMTEGFKYF